MADDNEGTSCDDPDFYCEYNCDNGVWKSIGVAHGSGYECPSTLSGQCNSGTTCASPIPKTSQAAAAVAAARRVVPLNTGDYLFDGALLHVIRAKTDVNHYCPPTLKLDDIKNLPVAAILEQLAKDPNFVTATINIGAEKKNENE